MEGGGEGRRVHSRVLVPRNARYVRQIEDRTLAIRTQEEFRGRGRVGLDLIANSLHHRGDTLRRIDAGGHDIALAHAQAPRGMNGLEERLLVFPSYGLPEPAECPTSPPPAVS